MTVSKIRKPSVTRIPSTLSPRSQIAQSVFVERDCPACGMPLLNTVSYPRKWENIEYADDAERAEQLARAGGCAFCQPDMKVAVFESDAVLLRFTDALGLTARVLNARKVFAAIHSSGKKEDTLPARRQKVYDAFKSDRALKASPTATTTVKSVDVDAMLSDLFGS
jgi:hypothetical protein